MTMQSSAHPDVCTCLSMAPAPLAPATLESSPDEQPVRYYQQIGADVIGNRLVIQMEKRKGKKRGKGNGGKWNPPCDCETIEIRRTKEGPKILNDGDTCDNRILFRVRSKDQVGSKSVPNNRSQAILYKLGARQSQEDGNDRCKTFTIYPHFGEEGSQDVHTDRITDNDQEVFLLKIKKNPESSEERTRNFEVEVRTPKPPVLPPSSSSLHNQIETPLELTDSKKKKSKKKRK